MLGEVEAKRRLSMILRTEEGSGPVDWEAIAKMSAELLRELPPARPLIVLAYLWDVDRRRVDPFYAQVQRSELVEYLSS